MPEPVQPGWRPDPERPEMLRWWNGLGWSDARKAATDAAASGTFGIRPAAEDAARRADGALEAARQSTVTPDSLTRAAGRVARSASGGGPGGAVTAANGGGVPLATAAKAVGAANPLAAGAIVLGILAISIGAFGVLPLIGIVVSLMALIRSRRLAREGARRTGFGQSLAGLLLSILGMVRWIPVLVEVVSNIDLS